VKSLMEQKKEVEATLADLVAELKAMPPWLLEELILGMMEKDNITSDEAIRSLAEIEVFSAQLLKASQAVEYDRDGRVIKA
jgi:hypothetical protein